jgi:hypothetical protein
VIHGTGEEKIVQVIGELERLEGTRGELLTINSKPSHEDPIDAPLPSSTTLVISSILAFQR